MKVSQILLDRGYPELKRYVLDQTGLGYYADKDEDFAWRVGRRMGAESARECSAYLALLLAGPAGHREMERLVGELTIGETYFFRQRAQFQVLRDTVLPDLLDRNRSKRRLMIWSAGCATGAEPYTVSIVLRLGLADRIAGWDISILGTDINLEFLARARQAIFDNWAFRETPEGIRAACFEQRGRQWELRPEFRKQVSFLQHNLGSGAEPPGAPFDLILCRNVMIYFDRERVRRTVSDFHEALVDGGWLLVGHSEPNQETFRQFRTVSFSEVTIYQKPGAGAPPEGHPAPPTVHWPEKAAPSLPPLPAPTAATSGPPSVKPPVPPRREAAATAEDARVLADRGEWNTAAALCRSLIAANPLNAEAHFTLGLILEHEGAHRDAADELRRAIYLDRGFALAHYHLGTCLQGAGEPHRAGKAFENAIHLLAVRPDSEVLPHGDGITVAELRDLAAMHLGVLGET